MRVPVWAADLADAFWMLAKEEEPFPRSLNRAISRALPLSVVSLPGLRIASVLKWLRDNGVACDIDTSDRFLHGCLYAREGTGFAFIDKDDPEDERRFSLAHELAHFLRDYWHPRKRIQDRVGIKALEVADGLRPPTGEERFQALLCQASLEAFVHWLDRDFQGSPLACEASEAENHADILAFELLAPVQHLSARFFAKPSPTLLELSACLQEDFGLPAFQANQYADMLTEPRPDPLGAFLIRTLKASPEDAHGG